MSIDWPLDHNVIRGNVENNTFGMVRRHGDGTPKPHQGWDFAAPPGTPCYAIAAGRIVMVRDHGDYGRQVLLAIDVDGVKRWAFYAHLDEVHVSVDEEVALGQQLGTTGKSGNARNLPASEDHLHFELRTTKAPGLGLAGRVSPREAFGICPLRVPAKRAGA